MWHIPPCANDMECKQLENSSHGKTWGTRAFGSLPQILSFKYIYFLLNDVVTCDGSWRSWSNSLHMCFVLVTWHIVMWLYMVTLMTFNCACPILSMFMCPICQNQSFISQWVAWIKLENNWGSLIGFHGCKEVCNMWKFFEMSTNRTDDK
jgi:hypothetical protein